MLKKISYLFLTTIILFNIMIVNVSATNIIIEKTAPAQINLGDNLKATITITNNENITLNADVKENVGDAQAIEPPLVSSSSNPNIIAAVPPHFEWNVQLAPNSNKVLSYTIKPNSVGYYLFSPTVLTTSDGRVFYSNTFSTEVLCNSNNICESGFGEDFTNCPTDCNPPTNKNQNKLRLNISYIIIPLIIIVIGGLIFFMRKKIFKKSKRNKEKKEPDHQGRIEALKKTIKDIERDLSSLGGK